MMEMSESDYKRLLASYRAALMNHINEIPVNISNLRPFRNLLYIIQKDQPQNGQELVKELSTITKLPDNQQKLILLKLISQLPLQSKIKVIDIYENELSTLLGHEEHNFQFLSVIHDILCSSYLLTRHNQQLHGATSSRIISLYSKLIDISSSKDSIRNLFEVVRTLTFKLSFIEDDPLMNKLGHVVELRIEDFLNRILGFEARIRLRLLVGFCRLVVKTKVITIEFITKLEDSIVDLISKINELECIVDGITSLCILLRNIPHAPYIHNRLLRHCYRSLLMVHFRKQYLQATIQVLTLCESANNRLKYQISLKYIQTAKYFQFQYTRLVIMKLCLRNLLQISKQKNGRIQTVMISLFHQKWFVTKLKEQTSLFKEQFLISLITEYFQEGTDEVKDILDICHRLLDWNCNMKVEGNIQTIKFTFDLYLTFLKDCYIKLGNQITMYLDEIVARINSQNINFLFKMKILTLLAGLLTYQQLTEQLKYDFIDGELKPFMMPKHPKSIFTASYAATSEGVIESSKEIEYIRNILNLLTILPNFYPQVAATIDDLIAEYRDYLTFLESLDDSNKQLITILLQLSDEPIITQVSKNVLLSIYQKVPEIAIYGFPTSQTYELINYEQESLLPIQSPTQLFIQPYCFKDGKLVFGLKTIQRIEVSGTVKVSSQKQTIEFQLSNGVYQIELSPSSSLDFEVMSDSKHIIGVAKYKVRIDWGWKRIDWFKITDPMKIKVAWKGKGFTATFLAIYWGEPLCISFEQNSNQLCICLCSKDAVGILLHDLQNIIDFLTDGTLSLNL